MAIPLAVPVIAGLGRAVLGIGSAKKQARRARMRIEQAYLQNTDYLNRVQSDQRQATAEELVRRGLANGGDVRLGGAVAPQATSWDPKAAVRQYGNDWGAIARAYAQHETDPAVPAPDPAARSLGAGEIDDLRREQIRAQNNELRARDNALQDVKSAQSQAYVDAATSGINTAASVYSLGQNLSAGSPIQNAMTSAAPTTGVFRGSDVGGPTIPSAYRSAYGGIDPVRPLERGTWAGRQNSDFHID